MFGRIKAWFRRKPCHQAYENPPAPRGQNVTQSLAYCDVCGKFYSAKPKISAAYLGGLFDGGA